MTDICNFSVRILLIADSVEGNVLRDSQTRMSVLMNIKPPRMVHSFRTRSEHCTRKCVLNCCLIVANGFNVNCYHCFSK